MTHVERRFAAGGVRNGDSFPPRCRIAVIGVCIAGLLASGWNVAIANTSLPGTWTTLSTVTALRSPLQESDFEVTSDATVGSSSNSRTAGTSQTSDDAERTERRRSANILVVLIGLILILGVAMLTVVMVWGHRVRRLARRPLPECEATPDPLWYLRNPPKQNDESAPPSPETH